MAHKILFLLALLLISSLSITADSGKVVVTPTITCADQKLQLNGFGTRKKLFIKLYVASLYVQEQVRDASQFLEMIQASCMRLHITSSKITSKKMIKATREGFEKSTQGNTAPIENGMKKFLSWLEQPIKKGDEFEFASALFGIWLGDMPAQQNLKEELLRQLHTL